MSKGMSQGEGLEDVTPSLEKNPQKNFSNPLDKPLALWYNKRAEGRCGQHQGLNRIEKILRKFSETP